MRILDHVTKVRELSRDGQLTSLAERRSRPLSSWYNMHTMPDMSTEMVVTQ